MWLFPPEGQDQTHPTSGQAQIPPTKKPVQASYTSPNPPLGRHQRKEDLVPKSQKVKQNEMTEEYVSDEERR